MTDYVFSHHMQTPAPVSSLSFGKYGNLLAGADDGSLRLYHATSSKVLKAIRGLGSEVASMACLQTNGEGVGEIWLASGRKALLFEMDSNQMILSLSDALSTLILGEDDEDVLNELTLNGNKNQLAYSTDSGTVGVVDLSTKKVSRMKTKHDNICGTVKFVPDRPSELVSGGYDSALLHFDFQQGTLLSRHHLTASPPSSGVSLSPPFILCTSISSTGVIAAGTADGRIWLGTSGEKRPAASGPGSKKRRSRKWEGLRDEGSLSVQVAEGPVVALDFVNATTLVSCTLLGTVGRHELVHNDPDNTLQLSTIWTKETEIISKVNDLAIDGGWIAVGGLGKDEKGVIEMWQCCR